MDIKQLHYFCTIVQKGTISKAAKELHLTQPPLSYQMKLLEEELGTALFIRGSRAIQLTESGKLLYTRAQSILELMDATTKELEDLNLGKSGTLKMGVISSVMDELLHQWILPFSKQYPRIHYEITEANTYELIEELNQHLIEMAIVRSPFSSTQDLNIKAIKEEPFYALGKKIEKEHISLKELSTMPLLIYRRWKQIFDHHFQQMHLTPSYYCINDDARTCIQEAQLGLGIALLPKSAIANVHLPYAKIDLALSSKICILTNDKQFLSTPTQLFLNMFS